MGFPIPHTKAVANGRYLAGLLTWNGLVKSEGLATPVFFCAILRVFEYQWQRPSNVSSRLFTIFLFVDVSNVPLDVDLSFSFN